MTALGHDQLRLLQRTCPVLVQHHGRESGRGVVCHGVLGSLVLGKIGHKAFAEVQPGMEGNQVRIGRQIPPRLDFTCCAAGDRRSRRRRLLYACTLYVLFRDDVSMESSVTEEFAAKLSG